jgi:hypothetical protein
MQEGLYSVDNAANVCFIARPADSNPLGLMLELRGHMERYHKNWNVWGLPSDLSRGVQAVHFWHLKIKHDHVGQGLLCFFDRFSTVRRLRAHAPLVLLFQQISQATAHEFAVVYDKNADRRYIRPCAQIKHNFSVRTNPGSVYTPHRVGDRGVSGLVACKELIHIGRCCRSAREGFDSRARKNEP